MWHKLWIKYHLAWAGTHLIAAKSANQESFSFISLGNYEEANRLNAVCDNEHGKVQRHHERTRYHLDRRHGLTESSA